MTKFDLYLQISHLKKKCLFKNDLDDNCKTKEKGLKPW